LGLGRPHLGLGQETARHEAGAHPAGLSAEGRPERRLSRLGRATRPAAWRPLEAGLELHASPRQAWALPAGTGRWHEWGPSIVGVEPGSGLVVAGLRGRVRARIGLWLPFEVTAVEPERAWRVAGVTATGHRVEPPGPAQR
jgi:hypothetical protein